MLWVVLNWRNVMVSLYDTFMQIIKMFSSLDKLEKDAFLYRSSSIDTGLKEGCLGWISASSFLLSCTFLCSVQNTQLNTAALVESENLKAFASSQTQTFWGKFWKIIVSSIQPLGSLSWAKITLKTERFHDWNVDFAICTLKDKYSTSVIGSKTQSEMVHYWSINLIN